MMNQDVTLETATGEPVTGKLIAVTSDSAVVVGADGNVTTVLKTDVTALKTATIEEPPAESKPANPETEDEAKEVDPKKKERTLPKLGLFMAHGVSYAHWQTRDYGGGSAAYALDFGAGYNVSDKFGVYGMVGGNVAAKIWDDRVKANSGHANLMLRYRRKYFAFMGGIGVGWNRLAQTNQTTRAIGASIPLRLMGIIPLPRHLWLGIAAAYELQILGGGRVFNGIGLQILLGRA
jgi:hypothetical protein